jgi:RNA polymerase sigma factor (sigma-70 family)
LTTNRTFDVIQHLRAVVLSRKLDGTSDAELLAKFIRSRDAAALEALVRRHAPMVWGVCRRLLNHHDAEDAFQATFLVLVRRSASLRSGDQVANWLHGVARQTALKARSAAARRFAREKSMVDLPEPAAAPEESWDDLRPVLDQELSRLPAKYRAVIVLCDLEGLTRKEAAKRLGCPEGTVAGRLGRARAKLAGRLARRGVVVSGGALTAVLAAKIASAGAPATLMCSTVRAATSVAAGHVASAAVSVGAAELTQGVLNTMILSKFKVLAAVLLVLAAGLAVGGLLHRIRAADPMRDNGPQAADPVNAQETRAAPPVKEIDPGDVARPDNANPGRALTCSELVSVFDENEAAGDERFIGKRVRVTGKVDGVERFNDQSYLLTLRSAMKGAPKEGKRRGGYNPDRAPVGFLLPITARRQLAELQKGQQATVEGVCQGRSREVQFEVIFTSCVLVKDK